MSAPLSLSVSSVRMPGLSTLFAFCIPMPESSVPLFFSGYWPVSGSFTLLPKLSIPPSPFMSGVYVARSSILSISYAPLLGSLVPPFLSGHLLMLGLSALLLGSFALLSSTTFYMRISRSFTLSLSGRWLIPGLSLLGSFSLFFNCSSPQTLMSVPGKQRFDQ